MCLGKDKKLLDTSRNWIIYPYIASGAPKESDIFFRGGVSISKLALHFFGFLQGAWLSLGDVWHVVQMQRSALWRKLLKE